MPTNLWGRLKGWFSTSEPESRAELEVTPEGGTPSSHDAPERARWLPAGDPGNPFDVAILDLMVTQSLLATTRDRATAERAISWRNSVGDELDGAPLDGLPAVPCAVRMPAARDLPDGILFAPPSMDQKWVVAWKKGRIVAARSWTGAVEAVADARHDGDALVLERVRAHESSPLVTLGALPETFEWLLRSHALGERIPFPLGEEGAKLFEGAPMSAFAAFGKVLFCGARAWNPKPSSRPLRSDGRVLAAVRKGDLDAVKRAVGAGDALDAPGTFQGYTALMLAVLRGDAAMVGSLFALGAEPNRSADDGSNALHLAVVHKAPAGVFAALEAGGADPRAKNRDGFSALHGCGECDNAWAARWLIERGAELDGRTIHGHTPLHVACALGNLEAAKALVEGGADVTATSPDGTPADIARREGRAPVCAWLEGVS